MKFTITKAHNKLLFLVFIRQEFSLGLAEAVYYFNNLPYSWTDLSKVDAEDLKKRTEKFAESIIESEPSDDQLSYCNVNTNPPPEYIAAMAWHDTLSEENKKHVAEIASWWNKPPVC